MIIAQALKNKEVNDPSQTDVSPNSKSGEMNHDSFDGDRRPSSGERIPNNGKHIMPLISDFIFSQSKTKIKILKLCI